MKKMNKKSNYALRLCLSILWISMGMLLLTIQFQAADWTVKPAATFQLPLNAFESDLAVFDGQIYYRITSGKKHQIWRMPVNQPTKKQKIYEFSAEDAYEGPRLVSFIRHMDGQLWAAWHENDAVMEHDCYVRLTGSIKPQLMVNGYYNCSIRS